jgi:hypothetical protein
MIFTCTNCNCRIATPSEYDSETESVECSCGKQLTASEHGQIVGPITNPYYSLLWGLAAASFAVFHTFLLVKEFSAGGLVITSILWLATLWGGFTAIVNFQQRQENSP